MVKPKSKFLNFKLAQAVSHTQNEIYQNDKGIEGAPRMVGMARTWQQIGMNNSVQDGAVGDRRVHSELSGVVVCSALTMVYHCIITHKTTA